MTAQTEEQYWEAKLTELRRQSLDTTRKAASGWAAVLAGVLGVYGTVAFAGGMTSLDKLASPFDLAAKLATIAAAAALLFATYFATKASQSTAATSQPNFTWMDLRDRSNAAARQSYKYLRRAKVAGLVAVGTVFTGSTAVVLLGEAEKPSEPPTVIAVVDGRALCGKLEASGEALQVDGVTLANVSGVTVVTKCP